MKEFVVNSFMELHQALRAYANLDGVGWLFRGQACADWPVRPKAGRKEFFTRNDLGRFFHWRSKACAYMTLPDNQWECLAIAQHHGLATRLLDWTTNPLVAAYFAVASLRANDGAIYAYFPDHYVDEQRAEMSTMERIVAYIPRAMIGRITQQAGVFTYHPEPRRHLEPGPAPLAVESQNLLRFVIRSFAKRDITQVLNGYGFNEVGLFPDLDGLSRHVNWQTTEFVHRSDIRAR